MDQHENLIIYSFHLGVSNARWNIVLLACFLKVFLDKSS